MEDMGMGNYPEAAQERAMTRQEVILRAMSGKISWLDAADILRMSPRSLRRWKRRYEERGYDGLFDRRQGRPSPRRVAMSSAEQVLRLYRERYEGWNVKHYHEQLLEKHRIKLSYTWVKAALQGAGLVPKERRRTPHRKKRERKPVPGMMLFMDGSPHEWIRGQRHDLILVMDDAHNEVYWAELVKEEDTRSCLRGLRGVIDKHGLFCSLYTDRGSHFFHTPHAGGAVDKNRLTQFGQVLERLGIEHIPSYSPEARGRIERMFQTWQGRIPQEFADAGITDVHAANAYLRKHLIGRMNRNFKGKAREEGSAFIPCRVGDLEVAFSLQHERVVNKDNTVHYQGRLLQIPPVKWRSSLARCTVKVCEHMDGRISVRYGPHVVAWFAGEADGSKQNQDAA
ncbi:MAG: ISNCY family transposase [Kiritimatiellae bacterium]|nr:ISNCY family transposase [Kiritimatiellia bacterium]